MANELEQYLGVEPEADGTRRVYIDTSAPSNKLLSKMDGAGDGEGSTPGVGAGGGFDLATITANISKLIENLGMAGVGQDYQAPAPMQKLLGLNGTERYQTWPEKMVRSGLTLPGDVVSGAEPMLRPGLRREDFTDVVPPQETNMLGLRPSPWQPGDRVVERAQDTSGLMGGGAFAGTKPGQATLGSGPVKPGIAETPIVPAFYSAVEHSVANAPQPKMGYDQWMGYLKNQPGVKGEELAWMGFGEKNPFEGKSVTKAQMEDWVNNHKVEIKEIKKQGLGEEDAHDAAYERAMEVVRRENPDVDPGSREFDNMVSERAMEEVIEGSGDVAGTKFNQYQLPGGENYREMLFTLPQRTVEHPAKPLADSINKLDQDWSGFLENIKARNNGRLPNRSKWKPEWIEWENANRAQRDEVFNQFKEATGGDGFDPAGEYSKAQRSDNYNSSHWDEPNVLAHTRLNDRVIDGKKSLHVEEIQSDWHQEGRKKGYETERKEAMTKVQDLIKEASTLSSKDPRYQEIYAELPKWQAKANERSVPDAPFKTTWPDLVLKRLIREASEKGYDQISWTPGEAQAARYDLSKQVDAVKATLNQDGTYSLSVKTPGSDHFTRPGNPAKAEDLPSVVGKELAQKIVDDVKDKGSDKTYEGDNLKIGGHGMVKFYDKMLVDKANALGKKFGAKVKQTDIDSAAKWTEGMSGTLAMDTLADSPKWKIPQGDEARSDWFGNLTSSQRDQLFKEAKDTLAPKTKQPVYVLPITDKMREAAIGKGFPLFMSGIPFPLVPVDNNPWKDNK